MKITKVDILHLKTNLKNGHWRPIVCRIYTDEGISGTNTKRREGFNQMIADGE